MNFLQRMFYKVFETIIPNPIFAALAGQYGADQPQRMANDYPTWSKEGYCGNDTVYKCISYLSRNAALVDWGLYTDRFQREEIESHPILDRWHQPNPDQYLSEFIEDWAGTLLLGGNAFMKSEYLKQSANFTTPPDALYVLRPDWVDVIPTEQGILAYQFGPDAYNKEPLLPFQCVHTKYWNPGDPLRGLSPIQVAAIFVDMQTAGNKWNLALMQNSARPSGAWSTDQMLTKTDFDKLKDDLFKQHSGSRNAGKPPVLYGGLKWVSMSISPAELDWLNSRMRNGIDIANIYNLDPTLIGDTSASTMNNKEQAKLASYFEAIFPMVLNKMQATVNRWLVPKYGDPKLYLAYKPESVPAIQKVIQDQLAAQSDRSTKIYMAGGINLDEYREACGYDELPNKAGQVRRIGGILVRDADLVVFAQQSLQKPAGPPALVPENILDNPPPGQGNTNNDNNTDNSAPKPASSTDDSESDDAAKSRRLLPARGIIHKAIDLKTAEEKSAYLQTVEDSRQQWEADVSGRLQAYFKQEKELVHHAIDQAAIPSSAIDRAELAIKQLEPHLTDIISGIWQDVAADSGKQVSKQLKKSQSGQYERKAPAEFFSSQMITYLLKLAGEKVTGIDATTLAALQIALANGVEGGESIQQLAARIDQLYLDDIIPNRSQVIASTEVVAASNWGSMQAASQSGLTLNKVWLDSGDAHTRPAHAEASGQTVAIDEPFQVGRDELQYPGDPAGSPGNTINCRCSLYYQRVAAPASDQPSENDQPVQDNQSLEQMAFTQPPARKRYVWTPRQRIAIKVIPEYDRYKAALRKSQVKQHG